MNSAPAEVTSDDKLPIVHRLAIVYLMLPVVIWLVGWFEWWFGVPLAFLLVLAVWPALAPSRADVNWQSMLRPVRSALRPTTIVLLLIAFAWTMATASGGVFDLGNTDWIMQQRVLLALGSGDWPTELLPNFRNYLGNPILLRHNIAHYMVPGSMGKWLGVEALKLAVPLWTWTGVGLVLLMFTRGLFGWRAIVAAVILIFFSGMDIVRIALLEGLDWLEFRIDLNGWPLVELGRNHLEWGGLLGARIQFSSHMVGLMWVPKHFLAAALYALLLVQATHNERFLAVSGVLLAGALFWSPFVALGLLPLVLALFIKVGIRPFLRWQNVLLSLPLAVLLFVYLSSGTADIKRGWVWDVQLTSWGELLVLPLFYLTEFLVLVVLLLVLQPRLRTNLVFAGCVATLLLLPLYSYGSFNDLVMRGAMPALFMLCYYCTRSIAGRIANEQGDRSILNRALLGLLVAVLAIGAVTPLFELARANNSFSLGVGRQELFGPRNSILGVVEDLPSTDMFLQHYATGKFPDWFLRVLTLDGIDRALAGEELLLQAEFEVYLNDRTLVFVREPCTQVERQNLFFVHVTPLSLSDLPEGRNHFTFSFVMQPWNSFKIGSACVAVLGLPDTYTIGMVTTGQLNAERTRHSWIAHYFNKAYRDRLLAEADEPIIESDYTVYIHQENTVAGPSGPKGRTVLYSKPVCGRSEMDARIYLHVVPVRLDDLAVERREAGYDELDFTFRDFGGWGEGSCFAVLALPEYDVLEIRTGQEDSEGGRVWAGRHVFER